MPKLRWLNSGTRTPPAQGAPPPYGVPQQSAAAPQPAQDALVHGGRPKPQDSARSVGAMPPAPAQVRAPGMGAQLSPEQLAHAARLLWQPSVMRVVSAMPPERSNVLLRALIYLAPSVMRLDEASWSQHVPAALGGLATLPGDAEVVAFADAFDVLAGPADAVHAGARLQLLGALLAVPAPRRDGLVAAATTLATSPHWAGYTLRQELLAQLVPALAGVTPRRTEQLVELLVRCLPPRVLDQRFVDHVHNLGTLPREQFGPVMQALTSMANVGLFACDKVFQATSVLAAP